jgi:tetratricopeptide (TPR) repeat protein
MKLRILAACALACAFVFGVAPSVSAQGDKSKPAEVKVSGGERDAAVKVDKAKGAEAKLQAASEFVKKYPNSSLRPKIAKAVADEVAATSDDQLKISLAETYLGFFNEPSEAALVNDALLNAYINGGHTDEAFKMGGARLAKNTDDVDLLRGLTIIASNETIKGNNTYAAQGLQYGTKAIELLEADKRPEGVDDAKWASYKAEALPALYRATGIIAYKTNDHATAMARFTKAADMKINDPAVYIIMSELAFDEFDLRNKEFNVASAADKPAALKRRDDAIDRVIESYAHAVAVTDGQEPFKPANTGLREDLEKFYRNRHNNSTQGMQQLIDKYKHPATP